MAICVYVFRFGITIGCDCVVPNVCVKRIFKEKKNCSFISFHVDSFIAFLVVLCWNISIKAEWILSNWNSTNFFFFFFIFIACESNLSTWNPVWKCRFLVSFFFTSFLLRMSLVAHTLSAQIKWYKAIGLCHHITSCVAKTIAIRNHLMNDDLTMRFAYYKWAFILYEQEFCPLTSEPQHILFFFSSVCLNVCVFIFFFLYFIFHLDSRWLNNLESSGALVLIHARALSSANLSDSDDAFICYSISPTFAFLLPSLILNRNCAHTTFAALGDNLLLLFIQLYF